MTDWVPIAVAQITFSQLYARYDDPRFATWTLASGLMTEAARPLKIAYVGRPGSLEDILLRRLERTFDTAFGRLPLDQPKIRYKALLNGEVDLLVEQPGDVKDLLSSNRIRPVLTFLSERAPAFPDVTSMSEAGLKGETLLRYRTFFVQNGVPEYRIAILEDIFSRAWKHPDLQKFNQSKYMKVVDGYRNRKQALELLETTIKTYQGFRPDS
ncbi:tripartite tricarboxylate transporter substrate-binding protein [Aestuariispira insulae]|uniref:Tripartite tricarboxylate transporter family receptor n=1 Tax=Aestuariispira insulae TaxID=1461337 RepID=A0A3D9HMK4_9PROT|nr:tripartite tricarboxylate transporter substrate-binding protein [Aestuariispira insulae]RED50730.1 tripartite tricarboxylate transporter family receptor [Aestuariispira insulae]